MRGKAAAGVCTALLLAGLLLAGCGVEDASNPAGIPNPTASSADNTGIQGGTAVGATEQQIAAANLAPCPQSVKDLQPVEGGLPDVTLPCLGDGPAVTLSGLRGMPMVVSVWQSYCEPCLTELPMMGELSDQLAGKVQFLGIDYRDQQPAALQMAATTQMHFPSVQDPNEDVRSGLPPFAGVPLTLFVRADGTIAGRSATFADAAELKAKIEQYLGVKAQ